MHPKVSSLIIDRHFQPIMPHYYVFQTSTFTVVLGVVLQIWRCCEYSADRVQVVAKHMYSQMNILPVCANYKSIDLLVL